MSATRNDVGLCLLRLCGVMNTPAQVRRLRSLGLCDQQGLLTCLGLAEAYEALTEIRFGGSNKARWDIAYLADKEAKDWRAEHEKRLAQAAGKGGG